MEIESCPDCGGSCPCCGWESQQKIIVLGPCCDCRYWMGKTGNDSQYGICRRYPPQVIGHQYVQPEISRIGCCGEFDDSEEVK